MTRGLILSLLLGLTLGLPHAPAGAQTRGVAGMTPEHAAGMAEKMMESLGAKMGLDAETLRNASEEERKAMMRQGAEAMAERMTKQMEERFGMSIEELKTLSEDELRARMPGRGGGAEITVRPLMAAPRQGFPDGAVALPVGPGETADLSVAEPAGAEVLLVVADAARHEIVRRETRVPPFEERLALGDLSLDPNALVIEVIDPATHRVIRRYRPVAAE